MQRSFLILTLGIAVCLQSQGCSRSSPKPVGRWAREAERDWAPDLFFDDPNVLRLCEAIRKKDYAEIDCLVKTEGVDINTTGHMNVTPLFWAFPLGFPEVLDRLPDDIVKSTNREWVEKEVVPIQREYLSRHAQLLEHLLKLGANPNIKTTPIILARLLRERKHIIVPGHKFEFVQGLSVTHLAAVAYCQSSFSFLPIVLANGGDPDLVGAEGKTPVLIACGAAFGWIRGGPSAENVALLIESGADFEIRTSGGNTPILVAAQWGYSRVVFMLLHAGVDFRAQNDRGRGLASFTQQHQRRMVEQCRRHLEEFPDADWVRFDPYHLEVANFLEQEGLLPTGTHAEWKQEFDQIIEEYGKVAYDDRDPFVDEWVAKRKNYGYRRRQMKQLRKRKPRNRNAE